MRNEIREALESIASSWVTKTGIMVFAALVILTTTIALAQNLHQWTGTIPHAGIASINVGQMGIAVGTMGTAAAFLTTLYALERNYRRRRKNIPHPRWNFSRTA